MYSGAEGADSAVVVAADDSDNFMYGSSNK